MRNYKFIIIAILSVLMILAGTFYLINKKSPILLKSFSPASSITTSPTIDRRADLVQAEKIKQEAIDYVKQREIEANKKFDDCKQGASAVKIDKCYYEGAGISNNESWCDKISDDKKKQYCHNRFAFNRIVIENKNPQDCLLLEGDLRESCLNSFFLNYKKLDDCSKFQDADKIRCLDFVKNTLAYQQNDIVGCASIDNQSLKNNCEESIAAKPKDSDDDGISDDMERSYGTNPFNPDTDGDGYPDGNEIRNGHNPLVK